MMLMEMMLTKLMRKALLGDSDEHKKVTCNWVLSITTRFNTILPVLQSITSYIALPKCIFPIAMQKVTCN